MQQICEPFQVVICKTEWDNYDNWKIVEMKTEQHIKRKKKFTFHSIHTGFALRNFYLFPFPSSSFKMRFRKSATMRGSPSRSGTFGSQFKSSFALLISGFLLCGSSAVFGLNSIVALESIVSFTTYI